MGQKSTDERGGEDRIHKYFSQDLFLRKSSYVFWGQVTTDGVSNWMMGKTFANPNSFPAHILFQEPNTFPS